MRDLSEKRQDEALRRSKHPRIESNQTHGAHEVSHSRGKGEACYPRLRQTNRIASALFIDNSIKTTDRRGPCSWYPQKLAKNSCTGTVRYGRVVRRGARRCGSGCEDPRVWAGARLAFGEMRKGGFQLHSAGQSGRHDMVCYR